MKKILFLLAALLLAAAGFAQNKVEGVVMNENSEPLAGVAVVVKNTQKGVSTDAMGCFSIDAKKGETLVFSFIGMIDQSVPVGKDTRMEIRMVPDNYNMDDVVVIGYGSAKKSDLTGSVASIKSDVLKNSKIGMVSAALQGAAAGVQVTQGNMKPGADASILIRGAGSINAGTEPLYIVDGVPVDERVADAFEQLLAAGKEAGVNLKLVAGYRTYDRQKASYDGGVSNAAPGTTEHNLGFSADIMSTTEQSYDTAKFEATPEYKWLSENAANYGFILRYPSGKEGVTGFDYEPWHYRYVGVEQAQKIKASGLTLEEYLAQPNPTGTPGEAASSSAAEASSGTQG